MTYRIVSNLPLTASVRRMTLAGDTSAILRPGQFVQVRVPGFYLRRPISVCDWDADSLTLVYKVVGEGTAAMAGLPSGAELDLLTGLGNGFDLERIGGRPLLVGGGVGLPPLLGLCRALVAAGRRPTVLAGFNTAEEIFLREDFEALGVRFCVTTMDGSAGEKGLVTELMPGLGYDSVCACGPWLMLRAVCAAAETPCLVSMEERMGCGFGACMGCTIQTVNGPRRVCADGPVFGKEEILWQS